jgi:hypothetical protein
MAATKALAWPRDQLACWANVATHHAVNASCPGLAVREVCTRVGHAAAKCATGVPVDCPGERWATDSTDCMCDLVPLAPRTQRRPGYALGRGRDNNVDLDWCAMLVVR